MLGVGGEEGGEGGVGGVVRVVRFRFEAFLLKGLLSSLVAQALITSSFRCGSISLEQGRGTVLWYRYTEVKFPLRRKHMAWRELLAALQFEIQQNTLSTLHDESGSNGVVVTGCPKCRKKFQTTGQFVEHTTHDVMPTAIASVGLTSLTSKS
jgi:hypothetical protein